MSHLTIQNCGLKAASLTCHGIGYTAEAVTEVAKTAKIVGIATATYLAGALALDAMDSLVNGHSSIVNLKFPNRFSDFCAETTTNVRNTIILQDGTSAEQWYEDIDPCGRLDIDADQVMVPIVFVGVMGLVIKASPLIAKSSHDLGKYFSDLSNRNVAQIK